MRPLVPHDNASNLQGLLPHYVLSAEVLDGLGIADGLSPLEFTFEAGGQSRTVTLAPIPVPAYVSAFRIRTTAITRRSCRGGSPRRCT